MLRRQFLTAGIGLAGSLWAETARPTNRPPKFKALAFDAFPIFDPRSVAALCESLFPGRGAEFVGTWRTRQFEYTWLRTVSNRYADFAQVTADSALFAAKLLKLDLTREKRDRLLAAHFELKTWPDAPPVLRALQAGGTRLAFLSNFTSGMLDGCIQNSGLTDMFEQTLSTDAVKTFKPDVRAYQLGVEKLRLPPSQILFVAFAGWDAAGAKTFGYPTFWVNRLGLPVEELGAFPDATGANLTDLLAFLGST